MKEFFFSRAQNHDTGTISGDDQRRFAAIISPALELEMKPIDKVRHNKGMLSGAITSLPEPARVRSGSGSAHQRNLQLHLADKGLQVEIAVTGRENQPSCNAVTLSKTDAPVAEQITSREHLTTFGT